MTGKKLKEIAERFFWDHSLGPEFVKQWDGCVLLTAEEAVLVTRALLRCDKYEIGKRALALLAPDGRDERAGHFYAPEVPPEFP